VQKKFLTKWTRLWTEFRIWDGIFSLFDIFVENLLAGRGHFGFVGCVLAFQIFVVFDQEQVWANWRIMFFQIGVE